MSVRMNLLQEGVRMPDGRIVQREAFYLMRNQVPVFLNGSMEQDPIGYARDLQRDEDGWLSMDITLRIDLLESLELDGEKIKEWYDFTIFANHIKRITNDLITSGEIKAIYMMPLPASPKGK